MKHNVLRLIALAVTIVSVPAVSQVPLGPFWSGEWIACPNAPTREEGVFHFRKSFTLAERPKHLLVQVSADNQFLLFVNGQQVGRGPARGDLAHWRYETFDLAPYLQSQENSIGATVWNFGLRSAVAQVSDRTGFYINSIDKKYSMVETNSSWEVEREKGISTRPEPTAITSDFYAGEPATSTDGMIYDWAWESAASTASWQKAESLGVGIPRDAVDSLVKWRLVPDLLPAMQMELAPVGRLVRLSGLPDASGFPGQGLTVPSHTKASLLIDNGQMTTAYPELTVSQGEGALVRLTYTEALKDKHGVKGNRNEIEGKVVAGIDDEFRPDGKAQRTFQPLVWRTWRYLQIEVETGDQPLRLESLRSWFTAFPFEERGSFLADDSSLIDIWKIGWRTARLDAHSTYMDTPYWEQLQYVGDTRIQALVSYAVAGDDRLAKQAIDAINDTRVPDGVTLSRGPTSLPQYIPTFSLFWVDMIHDFWMYRDDPDFTRKQIAGTRTVLDWFIRHVRADGMVGKLPWWPFVDWTPNYTYGIPPQDEDGGSAIITLQFVAALRDAADLETAYGDPARSEMYRKTADHAVEAVRTLCWNGTVGLVADTKDQKQYSPETNAFAVWLDVIPRDRQQEALRKALSVTEPQFKTNARVPDMSAPTYYFRFYIARALEHAGMGDSYTQLLDPWRKMMAMGLTTWAETPEPTRSDSHAWSASPTYDLPTIVGGIRPETPGFRSVLIEPHLASLNHVIARMPHPHGMITVDFTRKQDHVACAIELPTGVDGKLVWQSHSYPLHGGEQHLDLPLR